MPTKNEKPSHIWDIITEYRMGAMVKMELKHTAVNIPRAILDELHEALKVIAKYDDQLVITTCLIDYILHGDVRLHTTVPFVNTYILDRLYDMYDAWVEEHAAE